MRDYSLSHVSDAVLLRDLAELIRRERGTMASALAHIAEVDARKLFAPLGYSSMFAYCVEELRLSEDAAYKRIQAARAARQFPVLFAELAEGRLHLTAICLLAPHLTPENAAELVRGAAHRRQSEIQDLLRVCAPPGGVAQTELGAQIGEGELAAQQVGSWVPEEADSSQLAVQQVGVDLPSSGLAVQQVGVDSPETAHTCELAAQQVGTGSLLAQVEPLVFSVLFRAWNPWTAWRDSVQRSRDTASGTSSPSPAPPPR